MTLWEDDLEPQHRGKQKNKINKDRFCKKNNLGHGRYGPHVYGEKNRCVNCNKISPSLKRREYTE